MRVVIQRVTQASVQVNQKTISSIANGLLVLAAFEVIEKVEEMDWMVNKLLNLRIFNDSDGKMNVSIKECNAELLVVSQFTLFANTHKGNRPSYIKAAPPTQALEYYRTFLSKLKLAYPNKISTGEFGANMKINLINDGPVTLIIDSKSYSL